MTRDTVLSLFVAAVFVVLAQSLFFRGASADLLAVWMAASFAAAGEWGLVYAQDPDLFTMRPPEGWEAPVAALGHEGRYFPYLYPPLWAALIGPVTGEWPAFVQAAGWVNAGLLAMSAWLAARAARPGMPVWLFMALALAALSVSTVGLLAMFENQPQIFVTFLLILTIERHVAGAPRVAGAVLALAAAIKLYPALFVLVWLIRRDWAFVTSFAITGALLAALSVALAGWPAHAAFLDQLSAIGGTVLITGQSLNFDTLLALVFRADALEPIAAANIPPLGPDAPGWRILPRPVLWQIGGGLILLAIVITIARAPLTAPRLVAMMTFCAIFSPMAWGYYYMPLLLFLPLFPDRIGWTRGGAILALHIHAPTWPIFASMLTALEISIILSFGQIALPPLLNIHIALTLLAFAIGAIALVRLHSPDTRI